MAFVDGSETVLGPVEDVMPQVVDPRTVDSIELYARFDRYNDEDRLLVKFQKYESNGGASVYVVSPDQAWCRATFSSLVDEVARGAPRWSFVRDSIWRGLIFAMTWAIIAVAATLVFGAIGATHKYAPYWAFIPAAVLSVAIFNDRVYYYWLSPPFEVKTNDQSSGTRRLIALASIILTIPIGILVNVLSPS